jgi:hypothetical protein
MTCKGRVTQQYRIAIRLLVFIQTPSWLLEHRHYTQNPLKTGVFFLPRIPTRLFPFTEQYNTDVRLLPC